MLIREDGDRVVVEQRAPLVIKVFGGLFLFLLVVFPLILVLSLVLGPRPGAVSCDRAKASCVVERGSWHHAVPLADVMRARVEHRDGESNASASLSLAIDVRAGKPVLAGEAVYHDDKMARYREVADGMNRFLADPSQPRFEAHYVASDTDWFFLILFSILSPLWAYAFVALWEDRHLEIDRAARRLTCRSQRKLRAAVDKHAAFDDVRGVGVVSVRRWASVTIETTDGNLVVARLPNNARGRAYLAQLCELLPRTLGTTATVSERVRDEWKLPAAIG